MTGALARWPGLSRSAALMAGLAGLFALGVALDPRLFAGESVWLKPLKFALSVGLHLATIALLLAPLPAPGRAVRAALAVVLVAGWFELLWIGARAGAGQPSHFAPDALGAVMFGLMGLGATLLTVIPAALGAVVLARGEGPWRVPAGLGLLVGGALGFVSGAAIGAAGGRCWAMRPCACHCSAGRCRAGTCGSRISSGCTRCRACRWPRRRLAGRAGAIRRWSRSPWPGWR